jgi:hypothetical protein
VRTNPAGSVLQHRLLDKLLLHEGITRRQIGDGFGISKVAASRHLDWLKTSKLGLSQSIHTQDAKRPVELVRVNGGLGTAIALSLRSTRIEATLLGADGSMIEHEDQPVESQDQIALLDTVRGCVDRLLENANQNNRSLDLVGLSLDGILEPSSGMLFSVAGVADWQPCHLGDVLPQLVGVPVMPWTYIACRLRGFAKWMQIDHEVGYIACRPQSIAVATMQHGSIRLGRIGTAGAGMHRKVGRSKSRCICGETGCLHETLRQGKATPKLLLEALPSLLDSMGIKTLGIEWPGDQDALSSQLKTLGITQHRVITDGPTLERDGLTLSCARAVLHRKAQATRRDRSRPIVNHRVFQETLTPRDYSENPTKVSASRS